MNLRRAAIFCQVVDDVGFTTAARTLGMPKSAVSSAVSLLETELGVRLLHRTSRRLSLTDAGAALYARAAPALAALREASEAAVDAQSALSGVIRITAPVEVGTRLLEPMLARFLELHPCVTLDVTLTTRVLDLAAGDIDLAVRGGPVHDDSLVARKLSTQDTALVAAPSYLLRCGRPRTVAALAKHACVVHESAGATTTWTLTGPRGVESVDVHARVRADQFAFIVRAVVSGVGIGLLPLFLCSDEVARGALVRVLPKHAVTGKPLHVLVASRRYLPRRVAALRDFLVAEATTSRTTSRPANRSVTAQLTGTITSGKPRAGFAKK